MSMKKNAFQTEEIATPVVLGQTNDSALDPFQRKIYRATMML